MEQNPHKFEAVVELVVDPTPQPQTMPEPEPIVTPPAPPEASADSFVTMAAPIDLSVLSPAVQRALRENLLIAKEAINEAGIGGLQAIKGIGPATAQKIMELAE